MKISITKLYITIYLLIINNLNVQNKHLGKKASRKEIIKIKNEKQLCKHNYLLLC